jgi:4'-phosphopantetheinyl transferase EntD
MLWGDSHVAAGPAAMLAPWLCELLPPGAVAAELRGDAQLHQLPREERHCVRDAWPERQRQFAAGRLCARRALAELGVTAFPLLIGSDRRPLWPAPLVGSITHTAAYCAAAVWNPGGPASLGLDVERVEDVVAPLWPRIATPAELSSLETWSLNCPERAAALVFAAKEAFYKCQFGLTGQILDFHAVRIGLPPSDDVEGGEFFVRPLAPIELVRRAAEPWVGHFRFRGEHVFTAMAIQA